MDNKKKIIITIAMVAAVLILVAVLFNNKGSNSNNNGQIANFGDKLEINEKSQKFNIKVLTEPAKYTDSDSILGKGDYIKIKVAVENLDDSELSLLLTNFSLVDSSKNTIATATPFYSSEDSIFDKTIASGDNDEGYLYCYDSYDEENGVYTTDYTKLNSIKYLKVSVISDAKKNSDGTNSYNRKDYYLEIK